MRDQFAALLADPDFRHLLRTRADQLARVQEIHMRVDPIVEEIWSRYDFRHEDTGASLDHVDDLYLCDGDEAVAAFYDECDYAFRECGFIDSNQVHGTWPTNVEQHKVYTVESLILSYAEMITGVPFTSCHMTHRDTFLELVQSSVYLPVLGSTLQVN